MNTSTDGQTLVRDAREIVGESQKISGVDGLSRRKVGRKSSEGRTSEFTVRSTREGEACIHARSMHRFLSLARLMVRQPAFAGLLAANFALGMAYSFVVPFMSLWGTTKIGMSPLVFSLFMTITALSAIVVSTVLARWSDSHLPRRVMLILGGSGGVIGYLAYGYLRNPIALVLVGCTALAVASVNFSQLFSHVRETFDEADVPDVDGSFLVSVVRVCFSIAWTVGPAIGAAMMDRYSFEGVFLGAAGLYFLFLIGVLTCVPNIPRPPGARTAIREPVWQVLTRRDILTSFSAFVLVFAAHAMNMMNLPLTVTRLLGGNAHNLGIIFGVGPVAEIPLMLWFGLLAARGHQMALIRIGAAATVAYFLALSLAQQPWHIYPIQILSGVSFAILTNVTILYYQDMLPGQAGLATNIFSNSSNLGNLLGYFSFGGLLQAFSYRGVFLSCAALTVVALILLLLLRATGPSTRSSIRSV